MTTVQKSIAKKARTEKLLQLPFAAVPVFAVDDFEKLDIHALAAKMRGFAGMYAALEEGCDIDPDEKLGDVMSIGCKRTQDELRSLVTWAKLQIPSVHELTVRQYCGMKNRWFMNCNFGKTLGDGMMGHTIRSAELLLAPLVQKYDKGGGMIRALTVEKMLALLSKLDRLETLREKALEVCAPLHDEAAKRLKEVLPTIEYAKTAAIVVDGMTVPLVGL